MPSATVSMPRKMMRAVERFGDDNMCSSFSHAVRTLVKKGFAHELARQESQKSAP